MTRVDAVVVGAGVVGLAIGCELARRGHEVLVLEREARAGEGVSSRNSGVIHAGLYYPTDSLKAKLCVQGRELLYRFCAEHQVPHRQMGKWVVASDQDELAQLRALQVRAEQNGLGILRWVEGDELKSREPALRGAAALDVPHSGIVDVAEFVMALSGELQSGGGALFCHTEVRRIEVETGGFALYADQDEALHCRWLINAAGLGAPALAAAIDGLAPRHIPTQYFASGHYYRTRLPVPFSRLVYPLPGISGLGVHLGFDAAGLARFGPDVRFIEQLDYRFDDSQRDAFAEAIRQWWPAMTASDLVPDFVGIRPKLVGPGVPNPDFQVQAVERHGLPGLINLFGIESPGLTCSLALAQFVADRLAAAEGN